MGQLALPRSLQLVLNTCWLTCLQIPCRLWEECSSFEYVEPCEDTWYGLQGSILIPDREISNTYQC